ncbi:MAG TPA: PEGA domain-containing protein [Polyangiaceae bacterium]|nr:PEGA domain-containing protein [Polyangiaceae bacterium]
MRLRILLTTVSLPIFMLGPSLITSRTALAQGAEVKASAQKKAREGQRLADKGQHERALALFKEAFDTYQEPGYLYNIGIEQEALGHDVEAFLAFERFLKDVQKIPPEFIADANRQQRELRKRIGELELRCTQERARVSVDDRPSGETPIDEPVRVAEGAHLILFQKDGFEPFRASINVTGGSKQRVEALMRPMPVAANASDKTTSPRAPETFVPLAHPGALADQKEANSVADGGRYGSAFHLRAAAGADFWLSGARQTPQPAVGVSVDAGYRVAGTATGVEVRLGVKGAASFVSEPATTDVLVSALFNPMIVIHAIPHRMFLFAELGLGLLVISGVAPGSVLLRPEANDVSGALIAAEVRPAIGAALAVSNGVAFYVAPALAWSPSPSSFFQESSILRGEIAAGTMLRF